MKYSIEFIRLVAVILITFIHTRNNFDQGIGYYVFRELPTYGTAILSIISGYLYYEVSRKKKGLFSKKVKSLAIPYLIANVSILSLVLLLNFVFDYNVLNRLTYDYTIITEGLFSLNSEPINPPTFFIRDIFIIFSIIALFTQKEFRTLLVIVPVLLFGTLILRMDVAFLFLIGVLYARYNNKISKKYLLLISGATALFVGFMFYDYLKFPVSFFIFVSLINLDFKFYNTGRFSYLLHLYHSPIIVVTYPFLSIYIKNPVINVLSQISIAIAGAYILFLLTKRFSFLKILSGGR